jgi:hypothetical protein
MRRRTYLTTAGITLAALAGCTSSEGDTEDVDTPTDDETEAQDDSNDENTDTETETEEETTEVSSGKAAIEITEHELVVNEGDYSTDVYVLATVENTGDAASGQINLTAEWYDDSGNFLDNDDAYLASLGAGETWSARVFYLGSDGGQVADYEFSGEFNTEPPADPDGLELTTSELQVGEDTAVISGEVANNRDESVSYVEAVGKFYDGDGVVLKSDMTNVSDLPAGETWSFEVEALGHVRYDAIADHEVIITT